MHKQTINYVDFNGVERQEDFYFHLSLPEVTRIEAEIGMPIPEYTEQLTNNKNLNELLKFLERVILSSYGQKTQDGRSFHKTTALREEFENSQAYAELFEVLLTDPEVARKFGEGVTNSGKAKRNSVAPQVVTQ